jgi:hypothetical protein
VQRDQSKGDEDHSAGRAWLMTCIGNKKIRSMGLAAHGADVWPSGSKCAECAREQVDPPEIVRADRRPSPAVRMIWWARMRVSDAVTAVGEAVHSRRGTTSPFEPRISADSAPAIVCQAFAKT